MNTLSNPYPFATPFGGQNLQNHNSTSDPAGQGPQSLQGTSAFLASLHHRLIDRVALDWARGWLHAYSHLELTERHGWPLLLLVLEAEHPGCDWTNALQKHVRLAGSVKGGGPFADLAASIEVVVVEVAQ